MDAQELLGKVRKIEIRARGLSRNVFAGEYHSAFRGRGMAFSEVREYQYGDDVRDIDWNVTARLHRPYVKLFEEERELTVMLLVDVSGSLDFGTTQQTKRDMATEMAATLAFSAIQNNDKIGVVFFSDRIEKYIPPQKGRRHILYIIREMLQLRPQSRRTNIGQAIEFLNRVTKRRTTAFLISDFYDTDDYEHTLNIANRKHDVVAIQLYDPLLREVAQRGTAQRQRRRDGPRDDHRHGRQAAQTPPPRLLVAAGATAARHAEPLPGGPHLPGNQQRLRTGPAAAVQTERKSMRKQTILLLVLGVLTPILALAQAKVTARLDSTSIKVGSQCRLVVEVSARQGARILWPTLKDHHLSKEIEVVGQRTEGDNEEGQSTMRKVYTLTAWDEGRQTVLKRSRWTWTARNTKRRPSPWRY